MPFHNFFSCHFCLRSTFFRALYVLFALLFFRIALFAQAQAIAPSPSTKTLYFEHLPTPSVIQSVVYSIIQDSRGFMWFGTKDGLYRYDGVHSIFFVHNPLDSLSISDNRILNVFEDHDGDVWVSTQDGGLNMYNRVNNSFIRYQPKHGSTTAIWSNRVAFTFQDRSGQMWVGTENGLHKFDKKTRTFRVLLANENSINGLPSNYVRSICETRSGELWIGTVGGGLCRFNAASETCIVFQHDKSNPKSIADNTIHSIAEDASGTLWLGTPHGLSAFHPHRGEAENFFNEPRNTRSLSENIIWDVLVTKRGEIWVATQNGLNLFHAETRDFTRFGTLSATQYADALPVSYINTLYEDAQGRLWIGMYGGGASVIDPYKRKFDIQRRNPNAKPLETLPDNNIWAAHQDKKGNIWIGTVRGLAEYNPQTKQIRAFHNDTLKYGSMSDNINFITLDSSGKMWCSSYGGGINIFDTTKRRFIAHFENDDAQKNSLLNNRSTCVYCDTRGRMWIGTINGACRYNPETRDFTPVFTGKNGSMKLTHSTIKYFFEDSKGRFWIGTAGGLNLVNPDNGAVTGFKSIGNDTTTLTHNNIRQIIEDPAKRIWIATSGGLNLVVDAPPDKPENTRFQRITTANGLPNNLIAGVLCDSQGMLWLPHSSGVCSFNPATFLVTKQFDIEDGLQGQEFRASAMMNLRGGELFFGGANGFNSFNPLNIRTDSTIPRIVFTNFKVFNQARSLPMNITEAREITLSYKDYIFTIDFAALDFTNSGKTRYAYKMEGFDRDWVDNGELRSATYTNLGGGDYTFIVRASNHDGVWNDEGIRLNIKIIPPFWETWWFRAVISCALAGMIVLGVRARVRGVQRQNALLEATVNERTVALKSSNHQLSEANERLNTANAEKNEFLGIVAHDLKNPLSTIKLAAKMMLENAPELDTEDVRQLSGDILTTSNRMFDLITNLLDLNRLEQNAVRFTAHEFDIVPLLKHAVIQYTPVAEAKMLTFHTEYSAEIVTAFAEESATMQVIDNIVSNAVKYSPFGKNIYCTLKTISLENSAPFVQITVRDEGPGLSEDDMKKLFGKFARLTAQPTAGEHSTGLGLSIVKKIVEAMNGRVYCQSTLGAGATFFVELPKE